jgi:hypothetical protein
MTQALDANIAVSRLAHARSAAAPAGIAARQSSTFGTFAIAFGIAFAILYTLFERQNWPLFTYHPAVGRLDFLRNMGIPEDGPPMFWYGWVVLSGSAAVVIGYVATMIPRQLLYRLATFASVLAVLWPICFALAGVIDQQASFNAEFLRSTWVVGIPAVIGALAVTTFVSARWAERAMIAWLFLMPIGGLVVLGYSLNTYFTR